MRERLTSIPLSRRAAAFRLEAAVVLLLALLSAPAAAQNFDLDPYLAPSPTAGDFKVFELSSGGTLTVEVLEVLPEQKGLRVTTRTTETGLDPTFREMLVIPGKATLLADMYSAGLHIDLKKPMAINKTSAKPGKRNRIRGSGRAFFEGTLIGSAVFSGSWLFAGLEPLETPADSYPDTALLELNLSLTVKDRIFGDSVRVMSESASWHALGIGEVAERYRIITRINGIPVEDTGWIDAWLIDGSLGGEPIP